jgi:hypothetical protein
MLKDQTLRRIIGSGVHNDRTFLPRGWLEQEPGPSGQTDWHFMLDHFDDRQVKKRFACLSLRLSYIDRPFSLPETFW